MKTLDKTNLSTADSIVQELVKAKVEVVFGIVSIHNMPIYDAIVRDGSIHMVSARGESGAVNMADGYARATGKLGVVLTSTGAGAGNAAGALTESWNKGTPLLHITGEVASDYIGKGKRYIHECKDQLAMMEGASKKAYLLQEPEQTASFIRKAIDNALTSPMGPITVSIPTDFQTEIFNKSTIVKANERQLVENADNDIVLAEEMIQKIAQSKRPIIWAGGGVINSGASEEVKQLAELMQSAVLTSESGKGSIPENHPLCIGNFASEPQVEKLIKDSDLLISIGTRFRGEETNDWTLPFPTEHIRIDADPEAINLNYQSTYGLVGDAKPILQKLVQQLSKQNVAPDPSYSNEIESVRNQVRSALREAVAPYDQFADGMRRLMPNDAILVRDVTIPAYLWGNRLIDIYQPRTSIFASGGGIGQGLPTAIGAQIDNKDRTVVLMAGDGGFMVNAGELATASEEDLPLIVILFDDGGYGILRYLQNAAYGRLAAVNLNNPDYVMMSQSMGFEAEKVTSAEEFTFALETAIERRKPSMIVVDMDAVGPMNHPYEESAEYIASFQPGKS
ncbi:thiamine pyrophosphate-binding protein [Lentibacillus lipolyticus]|nr:thiamine pyrophosphate-binding protein [Lentibacillus lipolyticus]